MSRKALLTWLKMIMLFVFVFIIIKVASFSLFDDEFEMIQQIKMPEKLYSLIIYHIPSNASSHEYLQVRKLENGVEQVLISYERYNSLKRYEYWIKTHLVYISPISKLKKIQMSK